MTKYHLIIAIYALYIIASSIQAIRQRTNFAEEVVGSTILAFFLLLVAYMFDSAFGSIY